MTDEPRYGVPEDHLAEQEARLASAAAGEGHAREGLSRRDLDALLIWGESFQSEEPDHWDREQDELVAKLRGWLASPAPEGWKAKALDRYLTVKPDDPDYVAPEGDEEK